jgi:hypothetical protein
VNLGTNGSTGMNFTVIPITGKYLGEMGITPADTTDNYGCKRFQRYNVNYVGTPTHTVSSSAHISSSQMVSLPCCTLLCSIVMV